MIYTELLRLIRAFGYSGAGLRAVWKSEPAFRTECAATAILIPLALWLNVSAVETILLISSILLVLIVELANTAIETIVNRISAETHPLSKKAKDIGSAMVLLALVNAGVVWGFVILGAP